MPGFADKGFVRLKNKPKSYSWPAAPDLVEVWLFSPGDWNWREIER
jgi:hypothetical protein